MQHRAVLHIATRPYLHALHIPTDDCAIPDASALTHRHVSNDRCIRRDKSRFGQIGPFPVAARRAC